MNTLTHSQKRQGFTLMETMIALAVMTVLITGFLAVFGPAANSIRKALTIDEINRMQATVERELGTLRVGTASADSTYTTSFAKAVDWISKSNTKNDAIILYKYRGNPGATRDDGTLEPFIGIGGDPGKLGRAGENYVIQPMARRLSDKTRLEADLEAVEGRAFFVTMTQLVYDTSGAMNLGTAGSIVDPSAAGGGGATDATTYPEAVIAYQGSFFILPTVSMDYLESTDFDPAKFKKAAFTRNMAVRR